MFLTSPTLEELIKQDLDELIEMLVKQTNEYNEEFRINGATEKSFLLRSSLNDVQAAIEAKKQIHKLRPGHTSKNDEAAQIISD